MNDQVAGAIDSADGSFVIGQGKPRVGECLLNLLHHVRGFNVLDQSLKSSPEKYEGIWNRTGFRGSEIPPSDHGRDGVLRKVKEGQLVCLSLLFFQEEARHV